MADRDALFDRQRPLLFGLAYRMLGSVMDAEDIVQEAFLRWQKAPDDLDTPEAYLTRIVSRLAIDQLRSARARRETYPGPWLPEPLPTAAAPSVADHVALAESLSMAFLVLLERLSPTERAVFLLREVFDYDYPTVAAIVDKSEANCRQIVRRARQRLQAERPRFSVAARKHHQLVERFVAACSDGDMDGLVGVLAEDITLWSDGGGVVTAARRPVYGPDNVARFLLGLLRQAPPNTTWRPAEMNGAPALLVYVADALNNVVTFDVDDDAITAIRIVVNPEKLRHLTTDD